jgi:cytochrome c biogenesis protein CcdA/thiol-disulfide isomerase/thioredoxin
VIVGGSLTGEGKDAQKKKVLTIVTALGLSVVAFTLLLKASTLFIDIPENVWKWLSGGIIFVLGVITIFPSLWEGKWLAKLSTKSNILLGQGNTKKSFWGDVIMGAALGPVFSTCSPTYFVVLATVLPAQPIVGMVYLVAYAVGLCLSLFLIAFIGQRIMSKLNIAANPHGWFKRSLGLLFLLVGLAIITGYDKKLETAILNADVFDVTKVELRLLDFINSSDKETQLQQSGSVNADTLKVTSIIPSGKSCEPGGDSCQVQPLESGEMTANAEAMAVPASPATEPTAAQQQLKTPYVELVSPNAYLNTGGAPITIREQLPGKLVLVSFMTYSCVNCQRTFSHLQAWYDKYKDDGLVVIGIHTPEFAFEHKEEAVQKALDGYGITFPVVLDNQYQTWQAYGNRYWPRRYLIAQDGTVVFDHIGEGAYEETEALIKQYLNG